MKYLLCPPLLGITITALTLESVPNFRPLRIGAVDSDRFYRAAALDNLSPEDAQYLMENCGSSPPLSAVIDLRNTDEIASKKMTRTKASREFYQHLESSATSAQCRLVHVPILKDVDAFWDEAIARMDAWDRFWATLQTVSSAGALDRAAARQMEDEGLSMLYTVTLATAQKSIRTTLEICAQAEGLVIFHCQKGKDRTGLISMLLQSCLGASEEEIVESYAESGPLLGETATSCMSTSERSSDTFIDWSRFRGSPPSAMIDTLEWIKSHHGSVEKYITKEVGLENEYIDKLRDKMKIDSPVTG